MRKWTLFTTTIITVLCVILSGCNAGISVGPLDNPYGNAHIGIKHDTTQDR